MRGFGDTEPVPIDATRGLRDWADDTASLLARWASTRRRTWSAGRPAARRSPRSRSSDPVASLTFIDPVGPYGYGAVKPDGTPHYRTSRARAAGPATRSSPSACARATAPSDGDPAPRNVMNSSYWRVGHREPPEREDMLLGEILKSVIGDDGYPGDTTTSEHWPGVAPGTRGILNALSPKYCNWAGDRRPRPEAADPVDARRAGHRRRRRLAMGDGDARLARPRARVAGNRSPRSRWSRRSARCSSATTRRVEVEIFEESGHFPPIDARERWSARFFGFLESVS